MRIAVHFVSLFLSQAFSKWLFVLRNRFEDEILGFDVSMNHSAIMNLLKARKLH